MIFALGFPTLLTYIYFTLLADASTLIHNGAYGVLKTIQFGFPLAWFVLVKQQKLNLHLPTATGMVPAVLFGLAVSVLMGCLYQFMLLPTGLMNPVVPQVASKVEEFGANTLLTYSTLAVFYSLIHSGMEEYYWRWFVFGQLKSLVRVPAAIVISSIGFTAHHVLLLATFFGWASPLTWLFSLAILIGGIVWAYLYHHYGSIYAVWVSHMLVDAGIFWIGYDLVSSQFG